MMITVDLFYFYFKNYGFERKLGSIVNRIHRNQALNQLLTVKFSSFYSNLFSSFFTPSWSFCSSKSFFAGLIFVTYP